MLHCPRRNLSIGEAEIGSLGLADLQLKKIPDINLPSLSIQAKGREGAKGKEGGKETERKR